MGPMRDLIKVEEPFIYFSNRMGREGQYLILAEKQQIYKVINHPYQLINKCKGSHQ